MGALVGVHVLSAVVLKDVDVDVEIRQAQACFSHTLFNTRNKITN